MIIEFCGKDEAILRNVPNEVWNSLSQADLDAFYVLKNQLSHKSCRNEKFQNPFHDELEKIKAYVNMNEEHCQERSILTGVYFASNLICVNTQQLKKITNKCKSTINNSFQQMGFLSTKSKVRKYIETYLPILSKYPKILRQWTLRYSEPLQPPVQFKKIITPKRIQYPIPIINPPVPTDIPNLSISCTEIDSINSHDINFYDDFPNDNKDQMINEYSFTSFNDSQTTFEWDMSEKENSSLSLQSEFNDEPTIDYQND